MSGALALRDDQQDWTEAQKAALVQLGVGDAPRGDQLVFLHVSQRMRLDPFNKEIYMIGRWDPDAGKNRWTIQVGIDGFRSKSEEHPQFAGVDAPEWCGPDGQWTEVWLSDDPPRAARFTVYRKDQPDKPIRSVALYREYVQLKRDGKTPTRRWLTAPAHQLAKCAEALTRRTAFPRQLGGVYIPEEMEHLDNPQPPPVVIDAEPEQPAEPDWEAELAQRRSDPTRLKELLDLARGIRRNDGPLLNKISQAWQDAKAAAPSAAESPAAAAAKAPSKTRMNKLFGLLSDAGLTTTEKRHQLATRFLNKPEPVTSFADLNAVDVEDLIKRLEQLKAAGKFPPPAAAEAAADDTPAEQPEQQQPAEPEGDQQ